MAVLDTESRIALAADEAEAIAFLASVGGWLLHGHAAAPPKGGSAQGSTTVSTSDDGMRVLELHPASAVVEAFWVRLEWARYPHSPASVTFLDGPGGATGVPHAWPMIAGYRAPVDICMPFTAEGFVVHPEWRTGPHAWISTGNPLLRVIQQIQDDLDHRYQGRAA